jgi:DNA-binding response OmpR family regulator
MPEKILIVDDDVDTLRLVGLMLQRQGYQIVAANNGNQALIMAKTEQPDLILLDIMMPDLDGYEVTRQLRKSPDTSKIPIIMFTAKSQLEDRVTGFEVGADDYLTKPTQPRELFAHVQEILAPPTSCRTRPSGSTRSCCRHPGCKRRHRYIHSGCQFGNNPAHEKQAAGDRSRVTAWGRQYGARFGTGRW